MYVHVRLYCNKNEAFFLYFCALCYLKYGLTETKRHLVNHGD